MHACIHTYTHVYIAYIHACAYRHVSLSFHAKFHQTCRNLPPPVQNWYCPKLLHFSVLREDVFHKRPKRKRPEDKPHYEVRHKHSHTCHIFASLAFLHFLLFPAGIKCMRFMFKPPGIDTCRVSILEYIHTFMHIYAYIQTDLHTYIYTYIHIHIHTYTRRFEPLGEDTCRVSFELCAELGGFIPGFIQVTVAATVASIRAHHFQLCLQHVQT
jgi:hypothetical protein